MPWRSSTIAEPRPAAEPWDGTAEGAPGGAAVPPAPAPRETITAPRERGWFEVRWRQLRRAPRPVVRAVVVSSIAAAVLGVLYLAYDVAITRGAQLPGGDLRALAIAVFVVLVLAIGTVVTYLVVPQPTGAGGRPARTAWSGALGLLAAVPIAYVALILASQVLKPLILGLL